MLKYDETHYFYEYHCMDMDWIFFLYYRTVFSEDLDIALAVYYDIINYYSLENQTSTKLDPIIINQILFRFPKTTINCYFQLKFYVF